jgi:hypothetical protein
MINNIIKVMEENWDYLLILDACRYDYFKDVYKKYFSGEFKKGISLGSTTSEWLEKSFPDNYQNIIYISGNPIINSSLKIEGFDAKNHFYKIVDVWNFGWDEKLSTVIPDKINETTLNYILKFHDKKFIVHYLQPHEPYISEKYSDEILLELFRSQNGLQWDQGIWARQRSPFEKFLRLLFVKTRLMKNTWKIREMLNLPPLQPMEAVKRIYGTDGLKDAYKENLEIILHHVAELCKKILLDEPSKRIIITSDHGEFLGEKGNFCHRRGSKDSILLEVPFLKVKTVN